MENEETRRYRKRELEKLVVNKNKDRNLFFYKIKIIGAGSETRWMNITIEEMLRITDVLTIK